MLAVVALCGLLLSSCYSLQGGQLGCNGEPVPLGIAFGDMGEADLDPLLDVASDLGITVSDVVWYRDGAPIAGASGTQYLATEPGTYWATLNASASEETLHWLLEHTFFLPTPGSGPEEGWIYIPDDDPMFGIMLPIEWPFAGESIPSEGSITAPNDATIAWSCAGGSWAVQLQTNRVLVTPCGASPRADVAVVIYGGWNGIPVNASVGGTPQPTLYTALDAFGEAAVLWTFYPPDGVAWPVTVAPEIPAGLDATRWQYKPIRIAAPRAQASIEDPDTATVTIRQGDEYVFYFQLIDTACF